MLEGIPPIVLAALVSALALVAMLALSYLLGKALRKDNEEEE